MIVENENGTWNSAALDKTQKTCVGFIEAVEHVTNAITDIRMAERARCEARKAPQYHKVKFWPIPRLTLIGRSK